MASQTLLSSSTRTRQGEDFILGQGVASGQAVNGRQEPIQFGFRRKQEIIDRRRFAFRQALDFLNYFRRLHGITIAGKSFDATRIPADVDWAPARC